MLNWSEIPQKVVERRPTYEEYPICPKCSSRNTGFKLMNCGLSSPRMCEDCNYSGIKPKIIGYTEVLVEKISHFR